MVDESLNKSEFSQGVLEKLILNIVQEKRRSRRWRIFFKLSFLCLFLYILLLGRIQSFQWSGTHQVKSHVGLIDIRGIIAEGSPASAENIIMSLQNAFSRKEMLALVLRINSSGGTPVQSNQIYNELQYQRRKHPTVPVIAICEDACTSGAYHIAVATEQIYANASSIIGSIGVVSEGFGFSEALKNLGIERRTLVAGQNKRLLDAFQPLKEGDVQIFKEILSDVHQQFIQAVKLGRGNRLKNLETNASLLFSGLVWTGNQALPLGLIDGIGDLNYITREVIKVREIVNYTFRPPLLQRLADKFAGSLTREMHNQFNHKVLAL